MEHNIFKNPTQLVGDKPCWLFYKRGRGFELETTVNKPSKRSERDLNSGIPNYRSSALTARPRSFDKVFSHSRPQ